MDRKPKRPRWLGPDRRSPFGWLSVAVLAFILAGLGITNLVVSRTLTQAQEESQSAAALLLQLASSRS